MDTAPDTISPGPANSGNRKPKSHHRKKPASPGTPSGTAAPAGTPAPGTPADQPPAAQAQDIAPALEPQAVNVEAVNVAPFIPTEIHGVSDATAQTISATALVLITLIDGLAVSAVGEQAHMRDYEKLMITPPLEATLKEFKIGEVSGKYLNLSLLALGIMGWLMRVRRETPQQAPKQQAKPNEEPRQTQPAQAPAPRPSNGNGQPDDLGKITSAPAEITGMFRGEQL